MSLVPWKGQLDGSIAAVDGFSRVCGKMGTVAKGGKSWSAPMLYRVPLAAAAGNAGVLSIANPFGREVLTGHVGLHITNGVAQTIDAGVAADGVTSSDTLIDGASIATGAIDNIKNAGTNGGSFRTWGATQFITATASGTPTGLAGFAYITVIDP